MNLATAKDSSMEKASMVCTRMTITSHKWMSES